MSPRTSNGKKNDRISASKGSNHKEYEASAPLLRRPGRANVHSQVIVDLEDVHQDKEVA